MALGICAVVYRGLAYLLLKGMRMHWGGRRGGERMALMGKMCKGKEGGEGLVSGNASGTVTADESEVVR